MKAYIDMLYYYESEKWHTDYKGILTAAGGLNLEIKGN